MARTPEYDWHGVPYYTSYGQAPSLGVKPVRLEPFEPPATLEPQRVRASRVAEEAAMPGIVDRYGERVTRRFQQICAVRYSEENAAFDNITVTEVTWGDGTVTDFVWSKQGWREEEGGSDDD
jgi:hypothetical protein